MINNTKRLITKHAEYYAKSQQTGQLDENDELPPVWMSLQNIAFHKADNNLSVGRNPNSPHKRRDNQVWSLTFVRSLLDRSLNITPPPSFIPALLVHHGLDNLTVSEVLNFRRVCKAWRDIIDEDKFLKRFFEAVWFGMEHPLYANGVLIANMGETNPSKIVPMVTVGEIRENKNITFITAGEVYAPLDEYFKSPPTRHSTNKLYYLLAFIIVVISFTLFTKLK